MIYRISTKWTKAKIVTLTSLSHIFEDKGVYVFEETYILTRKNY